MFIPAVLCWIMKQTAVSMLMWTHHIHNDTQRYITQLLIKLI